jgi:putative DNA primase/helicase
MLREHSQSHLSNAQLVDIEEIRRTHKLLISPDQIIEVRALEATIKGDRPPYNKPRVIAGWFDNVEAIISSLKQIESATGIYITINPCQPALLARANNRFKDKNVTATNDKQIVARQWLLLDVDPDREGGITGIPTNNAEHQIALDFVQDVCSTLSSEGWPEPIRIDSGNGAYLLYALDIPAQDDGLVQRVLQGLAQRFDTDQAHIDQTTYNQARISRLPGTRNCKGDGTEDRPHRLSRIIKAPEQIQIVPRELLEAIAVPIEQPKQAPKVEHKSTPIKMNKLPPDYLDEWNVAYHPQQSYNGGWKWQLDACPFCHNSDHNAFVYIASNGELGFKCSHNSCKGLHWKDFRLHFEPDAYTIPINWPTLQVNQAQNGNGNTPSANSQQPDLETIIQRLDENEYGDGLLFAQVFNGQVCYDHSEKQWYLWNKHHWKVDTTGKVKQLVSGHLGAIYLKARGDIHKQIVETQAELDRMQKENSEDEKLTKLKYRLSYLGTLMEALEKRAKALRSANRMKNVLTFAMSEHNIGITGEIWDADPWLLGVKNGVIDLRTGQLRDGYPFDYIRSVSPTEWTGINTQYQRCERFLNEIFGDRPEAERKELIAFLQRLLGYSITGLVSEHIFPILYGEEGRNGKDTLFTLLKFVLGPAIANAVSNDVLLSAEKGRAAGAATPHLADLQGKRIVWGSETKQGDKFNVSQVKQLTGGGGIPARKNYGHQYTFDPTHTLFLMTNHRPHADAKDKAFWSRVCLIEFNMRFIDNPQEQNERKADANLPKELEAEASGILAMLVRGCLEYQKQGLNRPKIVEVATESYRASEDNIQQFIDECCVLSETAYVGAKRLYDTYVTWCKDNNLIHIDGKLFGKDISKRFVKVHKRTGWEYQKIGILTGDTPPDGAKCDGSTPKCDGSNEHLSHPSEPASKVAAKGTQESTCDGCDGKNQESPGQLVREDESRPLYGNTSHTRHTTPYGGDLEQPLERRDEAVTSQDSPVTSEFHPSHSLETFWTIGKRLNYPEVPDLDLKGGMGGWNTFTLCHRLRIPDVIMRLGGAQ